MILTLATTGRASAQTSGSVHAEQSRETPEVERAPSHATTAAGRADTCELSHIVFGWHPYWVGAAHETHDYSLLSDISYFSYEVDPATGRYTTVRDWKTTPLVDLAKASGTRVNLCVTLFSNHATLFASETSVATLIDSLVALVKLRDADGVNIDFEEVPASQRENFRSFMVRLADRFHREIPGSQVSMALPAVDWRGAYDVGGMSEAVDLFIIMGYGYHWAGSSHAGPVAPRHSGSRWAPIDLTRSIDTYLGRGIPKEKLLLGLPWYGYAWSTTSPEIAAPTIARGSSRTYSAVRSSYDIDSSRFDSASMTPWIAQHLVDTIWRQTWFDDRRSLRSKYELAVMKGIAGVGIWALGYDGGYRDMWDALYETFADCGETACVGEVFDMGGLMGAYHPDDAWEYRVRKSDATRFTLRIPSWDLADDTLEIFGPTGPASAPLATLTRSGENRLITVDESTFLIRFRSNTLQQGEGFRLFWECATTPLSVPAPLPSLLLDLF